MRGKRDELTDVKSNKSEPRSCAGRGLHACSSLLLISLELTAANKIGLLHASSTAFAERISERFAREPLRGSLRSLVAAIFFERMDLY